MPPEAPTVLPEQETEEQTAQAPRWKVNLLNDDVTTFEFVIWLLRHLFHKAEQEAVRLTLEIHETGSALITVTTRERAELYVEQVHSLARARGYPLRTTIEAA
jgi:ATP-dependent Clp protease adaptor protein ClpS